MKRRKNLWRGVPRFQSTETCVKPSMRSFIQDSFLPKFSSDNLHQINLSSILESCGKREGLTGRSLLKFIRLEKVK